MVNLSNIKANLYILLLINIFLFLNLNNIFSSENKIIFKVNDKAFTSYDYEMRVRYLDFVGNNINLEKNIILEDFISANLFFEYFNDFSDNKNIYKDKIEDIYQNIEKINTKNQKEYNYDINKENILQNIEIDFIRKIVLEKIINSNLTDLNTSNSDTDLLYKFNIKYLNFESLNFDQIRKEINNVENINFINVKNILIKNNINFFKKEKEINDIEKIDKFIRDIILSNNNFSVIEKNNKISLIFIEKSFETFNGLIANLYSIKSINEIDINKLKCLNLKKNNLNLNIVNKEYNFNDLNNELKNSLININDYIKFNSNDEYIYVILCDIKYDKDKLKNIYINKLINLNISVFEKKFINKYSKKYNLIRFNA